MPHRLPCLLSLLVGLCAVPTALAQERDGSDEDYARERIRQIAEGIATGQRSVAEHDSLIALHAAAQEVDPDWLRAIIVAEAVRPPEDVGSRVAPMGIDSTTWVGLDGATAETFANPSENVRLAALLLRRILDRLPEGNQSVHVVASLYGDIETDSVTAYGMTVAEMYERRAWERWSGGPE